MSVPAAQDEASLSAFAKMGLDGAPAESVPAGKALKKRSLPPLRLLLACCVLTGASALLPAPAQAVECSNGSTAPGSTDPAGSDGGVASNTACGESATATGGESTAIGASSQATGLGSTAIGDGSVASN